MKIPKLFKKAAAFVMAAVTALSIMPATAFAAGDIGTISFSHTYDSNGNAMRYNSSANIGGYNGQWKDRSYEPSAGDIIFFDWEGDGETDHVGIVEKCENGVVYTVEGNSGDACRQNQYTVGSSSIYGYGVPAY